MKRFKIAFRPAPGHEIPNELRSELTRLLSPTSPHDCRQFAELAGPNARLDGRVYVTQIPSLSDIGWVKKIAGIDFIGSKQVGLASP